MINEIQFQHALNILEEMEVQDFTVRQSYRRYYNNQEFVTALTTLHQAALEGTNEQKKLLNILRPKIISLNALIKNPSLPKILLQKFSLPEEVAANLKGMQIALPQTERERMIEIATLIPRIVMTAIFELLLLPVTGALLLAAACKVNFNSNPENIKKGQVPILLLQGSFNESEWMIGRQFLNKPEYGSVFTMDYGDFASHDSNMGIEDFARDKVSPKVKEIMALTGSDHIIIIGHSWGGMVAGKYAEEFAQADKVNVKHVITLATPWRGSKIIDFLWNLGGPFSKEKETKRYLQMSVSGGPETDPSFRQKLITQALTSEKNGLRKYFNIWSTTDYAVSGNQGCLTQDPRRQHSYSYLGSHALLTWSGVWNKTCAWLDEIYNPAITIKKAFENKGITITHEQIAKIENKLGIQYDNFHLDYHYKFDIELINSYLNKGFLSAQFFIDYEVNDFPFIDILFQKGVSPSFFLQHTRQETAKVLKWQLKPQAPIKDFLDCVNQYETAQEALTAWTTKASKETIEEWSKKPVSQINGNYSVNDKDFDAMLTNTYGDQATFNLGMETTIQITKDKIKNKEWNFDAVTSFCAFRRGKIAQWQNTADYISYGFPRGGPLRWAKKQECASTPLYDCYEKLKEALIKLHYEQEKNSSDLQIPEPMPKYFYAKSGELPRAMGAFYIHIEGKPIELSSLFLYPNGYEYGLFHTPVQNVDVLYETCARIFEEALTEDNIANLIPLLGQLYWRICQAKLWHKGDPSIAELIFRSVLESKGWRAPAWKGGITPWIEVSKCLDENEFAQNFSNLFAGPIVEAK